MKILPVIIFSITLLIPFQSYAKSNRDRINAELGQYTYPIIFKHLPDRLREFKPYFQAIAFAVLTSALVFALRRASEPQGYLSTVALAGILSVMIANSTFFLQLCHDTVHNLNKALNVDSTYAVAHRLYNAALNFHGLTEGNGHTAEAGLDIDVEVGREENIMNDSHVSSLSFFTDPFGYLMKGIKSLVVVFIGIVISATMSLCSFFVVILETIRYFLMQCGSLVLPIFISGLMTQSFRSQSITYIFGLIGMVCWPLGWSLGHIGTVALYDAIIEIVNGSIITDSGMAHKVIEVLSEVENPWEYVATTAGWLVTASIGSLLWLMLLFLGVVIWVIIVTLSAPFLIQKCVSCGAQFFIGIANGAAQTLARTIGGAASYGMVRSARSTTMSENGERPQPSTALRAGFSAARTLMNASRFQGEPSQLSQVFDTGLDELRQYRAEAAQVDIGRVAARKAIESVTGRSPPSKDARMRARASKEARESVDAEK